MGQLERLEAKVDERLVTEAGVDPGMDNPVDGA
jgi:hypothetical protein